MGVYKSLTFVNTETLNENVFFLLSTDLLSIATSDERIQRQRQIQKCGGMSLRGIKILCYLLLLLLLLLLSNVLRGYNFSEKYIAILVGLHSLSKYTRKHKKIKNMIEVIRI